jgi:hypothetical protein
MTAPALKGIPLRAFVAFVDGRSPMINDLMRTLAWKRCARARRLTQGSFMVSISLSQSARLTELGNFTLARALKSTWLSASRKDDGSYEIDASQSEPAASGLQALIPWRAARSARAMAYAELRERVALAEERVAELKTALDEMRAQRDAWQKMAQARIRPTPTGNSRCSWVRTHDRAAARGKYARRGAASVTYPGQISWEYDRTCRVSRYHARKEAPLEKPDPGGLPRGPVSKSACLISDERAAVAVCEHAPSTERPSLPCGRARLRAPRYATLVPPKGRSASIDPQPWQRTAGRWL